MVAYEYSDYCNMKSMENPEQFADFNNGIYVRSSFWLNISEVNFQLSEKEMNATVCLSLIILKKLKRIWNSLVQRYLCILEQNELLCNYQVACYHSKKGRNNWKWNPRPQVWESWQWNSERELERKRENKERY